MGFLCLYGRGGEQFYTFGTTFVCKSEAVKASIPLKGPVLFSKSVKFVGLPPSTSPDSGSPMSTHSLVSSKASSTAFPKPVKLLSLHPNYTLRV